MQEDICGITQVGGTGIEWQCVLKPHGKFYERRSGRVRHGQYAESSNPGVFRHYFRPKYPNRLRKDA